MRVGDHLRRSRCWLRDVRSDGDRTPVLRDVERSTRRALSDGPTTAMAGGYWNSYVTPVDASLSVHSRSASASSRDAALEDCFSGAPRMFMNPFGP